MLKGKGMSEEREWECVKREECEKMGKGDECERGM